MAEVSRSKQLDSSPDEVWKKIGGWATIHEWHPAIAATEVSEDGSSRTLTLGDGGVVRETRLDQGERSYTYRFDESPLPVKDYRSTIQVIPDGEGSLVKWEGTFEAAGVDDAEAVELLGGLYQAGLDSL